MKGVPHIGPTADKKESPSRIEKNKAHLRLVHSKGGKEGVTTEEVNKLLYV